MKEKNSSYVDRSNPGLSQILQSGGTKTRLSALIMGLGCLLHRQVIKGALYLAIEIGYIIFMIRSGLHCLAMLPSLGSIQQKEVWNEELQVYMYTKGDQSILILLYGLGTIMITVLFFLIWRAGMRSAFRAEMLDRTGSHVPSFKEDLKSLLDENLPFTLMTPPMFFIIVLTILPLIFMICMAFKN